MTNDLEQWRTAQRAALTTARLAVPSAERQRWSAAIVQHLLVGFPELSKLAIGFYSPFRGEPDVRAAVDHWRSAGATTALPVVVARGTPLEFRVWWPGAPMRKGVFAIPIPDGTATVTPQALLIPPLGFDSLGFRLGYGGGYFDRTLAALTPQPLKIAVAFEISRIANIAPQPYDVPMDFVVTERGIYAVTASGLELIEVAHLAIELTTARFKARDVGRVSDSAQIPEADDDLNECASPPCYAHEIAPD